MATTTVPVHDQSSGARLETRRRSRFGFRSVLAPLASLRLTVVLLGMGVFIVLAGTLAQAELGIETVVADYFRVRPWGPTLGFAWIPFQIFFPESFFPNPLFDTRPILSRGFWFPGGWLIGLLMFVNLLSAHAVRFTTQARGKRLALGIGVILAGIAVTAAVVASGSGAAGFQARPLLSYGVLWRLFQAHVVLLAAVNIGVAAWRHYRRIGDPKVTWIVTAAAPITLALAAAALLIPSVGDSSMRILWQLIKGGMAAAVLLAGCWIVFRKRSGIVLLHAGVGMLMISELIVGLLAVETRMGLGEGETKSWAEDIRTVELAVVDPSNPDHDVLTRFPASKLKPGVTLEHESIPFNLRIDKYFKNAGLIEIAKAPNAPIVRNNPADGGSGESYVAKSIPEVAGTSTGGEVDQPAAYVTVLSKEGQTLGTYLLSSTLATNGYIEPLTIGEATWQLALRFKRDYKPYAVTLLDVRKDDYVGTDTPRNYSSDVKVVSKELGADFERHIWMNNPLRFNGETLYQSGYQQDRRGREYTTLQIVRNTGWMLPYVSCMIVAFGMAAQFLVTLSRFLGRRAEARAAERSIAGDEGFVAHTGRYGWVIPAVVVLVFGVYLARKFIPPRPEPGQPNLIAFGELPVASHGRVKPIDTLARDAMKALSNNRQEFKTGAKYGPFDIFDEKEPAILWLLEFVATPQKGAERRVVRIENDELLSILELPLNRDGFMYSITEVSQAVPALARHMAEVRQKSRDDKPLTAADRAALDLERKLGVIDLLLAAFRPNVQAFTQGVLQEDGSRISYDQWYERLKFGDPHTVPATPSRNPPLAVYYDGNWEALGHGQLQELVANIRAQQSDGTHTADPAVEHWTKILDAWDTGDVAGFNAAVKRYQASLAAEPPQGYAPSKVSFEAYFNHAAPFYYLMIPYVFAALLAACSWLGLSRPLNQTAFWLIVLTFALHTLALIGRIYISGRPPVTNLYSSAVFIGWAAVAFGIGLERMFRLGFGNVLAGAMGFGGLLIAHNLSGDGSDTFSVMQAVLDTQFWLATHVVTVTLGYAATYVAGFLGLLYIVLGVATPKLGNQFVNGPKSQNVGQALIRMVYGVLCFAILFSFVGTVLGGLWADDSWGRFWGWDPKENGALIIVLWNALVLHARWGGIVKDKGLAVLAVAGNIAVSWSWFGTNELGVGLHSYGFTEGVLLALGLFVLSQLLVVAAGCLPKSMWMSFRTDAAA